MLNINIIRELRWEIKIKGNNNNLVNYIPQNNYLTN